jgi:hypothetical protein
MMQSWQTFTDPRFALRCKYPAVTPQGKPVIIHETERPGLLRAHLISQDSQEVYFEITRYSGLTASTVYQMHRQELEQRFAALAITPLEQGTLVSKPAQTYSFEWQQGKRLVYLVQTGQSTYRVLYNPKLPLNAQILATLEWSD